MDYLKLGYEFMAIVHISVEGDLLDVEQKVKDLKDVVAVFDMLLANATPSPGWRARIARSSARSSSPCLR